MLSCVCRPVNGSFTKAGLHVTAPQDQSIVVTCEPKIGTATILKKVLLLGDNKNYPFMFI
jgi:hypothetical protein